MKDLRQTLDSYSSKDLKQRKNWYSPAAEAYNKVRPRYPKELIERVVEITQLSPNRDRFGSIPKLKVGAVFV